MLALLVEAASAIYALEARTIQEVVPFAELRKVPHVPPWLSGLLRCRGVLVPVVDLAALMGGEPTTRRMSARIVIDEVVVGGVRRKVGFLCARVLDVVRAGDASFASMSVPGAPYLGGVVDADGVSAQVLRAGDVLPAELAAMLYDGEGQAALG